MNTARNLTSIPWGDRIHLLPKAMMYAFSLDLNAVSTGTYLRLDASDQPKGGLRHAFDQSIATMPEGLRCEVPTGTIEGGAGDLGDPNDPSSCWLSLKMSAKLKDADAKLHFITTGVINFDGGPSAFRAKQERLTGSAFLASCQTASTGTYRWLERRQIFGVGTLAGVRCSAPRATSDDWLLSFSFDFYAAG